MIIKLLLIWLNLIITNILFVLYVLGKLLFITQYETKSTRSVSYIIITVICLVWSHVCIFIRIFQYVFLAHSTYTHCGYKCYMPTCLWDASTCHWDAGLSGKMNSTEWFWFCVYVPYQGILYSIHTFLDYFQSMYIYAGSLWLNGI